MAKAKALDIKKWLAVGAAGALAWLCIHKKKSGVSGIGAMQRDWSYVSEDYKPLLITNYGDGEYGQQAKEFAEKTGTKLYVIREDYGYYFPDDDRQRSIYEMKLTRGNKSYTFTFGQSIADTGKFPTYYDIFASLTKNDPYSFEDFCADYGYDEYDDYGRKNKKAYQIYKAVQKEYAAVERLFGDVMDDLQEIY